MPRRKGCALFWVVLLGLGGCSQAKFVVLENDHGIVSIPRNTNAWPNYYRKSADELLHEKFPQGVVIDHEEAKVVGEEVVRGHTTSVYMLGMRVDRETERVHPVTEWYIYFHAKGSPPPPPTALVPPPLGPGIVVPPPPPPGSVVLPASPPPAVGTAPLPDQPIPVGQ